MVTELQQCDYPSPAHHSVLKQSAGEDNSEYDTANHLVSGQGAFPSSYRLIFDTADEEHNRAELLCPKDPPSKTQSLESLGFVVTLEAW